MNNFRKSYQVMKKSGFTLIEVMISILVGSVVLSAIVMFYQSQTRISTGQRLISEMIHNGRTAIFFLTNDLRIAGYSYNRNESWADTISQLNPGLVASEAQYVSLTYIADTDGYDNNGDGNIDETNDVATITYRYSGDTLVRSFTGPGGSVVTQEIADGIDNLEFSYSTDSDGKTSVDISLLVKTSKDIPYLGDLTGKTFTTLSGTVWKINDNPKQARRLFTTTVQCRNTGL